MSRMTTELHKIFDEKDDKAQPTRRQIKSMTKGAWAVFEILANKPRATQIEIAEKTGMSRPYISRIVNSQVFNDQIKQLRVATIEARIHDLAEKGIDRAIRIVENDESSDKVAVEATRMALGAMGFSEKNGGGGVNVQINNTPVEVNPFGVTADMVNEARQRRQRKILEGECTEVSDESDE